MAILAIFARDLLLLLRSEHDRSASFGEQLALVRDPEAVLQTRFAGLETLSFDKQFTWEILDEVARRLDV